MAALKVVLLKLCVLAVMLLLTYLYALQAGIYFYVVFVLALLFFVIPAFSAFVFLVLGASAVALRHSAKAAEWSKEQKGEAGDPSFLSQRNVGKLLVWGGLLLAVGVWVVEFWDSWSSWIQLPDPHTEMSVLLVLTSLSHAIPGLLLMLAGYKLRAHA